MTCKTCEEIGKKLKKNKFYNCQCGAKLLAVMINKELVIMDLSIKKEEK